MGFWFQKKVTFGGALLEFAVGAPVFFVVVLGLVDFSRILIIQAALQTAVSEASRRASLIPEMSLDTNTATDSQYSTFYTAIGDIADEAWQSAKVLLGDIGTNSSAHLLPLQVIYQEDCSWQDEGTGLPGKGEGRQPYSPPSCIVSREISSRVAVLRPGEHATLGSEETIEYPQSFGVIPNASMKQLLRTYPIVVEMRAQVDLILPFLGEIIVSARGISKAEASSPATITGQVPLPVYQLPGTWATYTPVPTVAGTATVTPTPGQQVTDCSDAQAAICLAQGLCPYVHNCDTCVACGA